MHFRDVVDSGGNLFSAPLPNPDKQEESAWGQAGWQGTGRQQLLLLIA